MKKKINMLVMSIFTIVLLVAFAISLSLCYMVNKKQNETLPVSLNTSKPENKKIPSDNYTMYVDIEEYEKRSINNMIKQSFDGEEPENPVYRYRVEPVEGFIEYDIDLPQDMQMHSFALSQKYNVDVELVYAIMWHESRFIWDVPDNVNTNGTHDRGLMQINEVNWNWLAKIGLDVNDPYDNIECGVYMLSYLMNKYDTTHALMAYQCGEGGMKRLAGKGYVTDFVYEIMDIKNNVRSCIR